MENLDNGRSKINSSYNGTEIIIPSKKNWFALIFGTAWMGGWYFGFKMVLSTLTSMNGRISAFSGIWLIMWTVGGLAVIGTLLWGYFGKESLLISNNQVIFKKAVFGVGQNRKLKRSELKNIRFNQIEENMFANGRSRWAAWGLGDGKIKFDYGMKTYSLGMSLDDAEANYLIQFLKEKI